MKKPIIYEEFIDVRFSDLDPYNHVNSNLYMEYVLTSRWIFAKKHFDLTADELVKKGIGFYIKQSLVKYKRPIIGYPKIFVTSHISKYEGPLLQISFEIRSEDKSILHSEGVIDAIAMDLNTIKPNPLPDWAERYFLTE